MPDPRPNPDGLTLTRASVALQGRVILQDLTLDLTEQRIGIIGRNGSGKTTLLRLMAGLIAPGSGTVRLGNLDPFHDRKAMLSRLGILFQNPDHQILFPTVIEELTFGLRQQGLSADQARSRALAALTSEGRADWCDLPCHHLSQGQRHYLCLMAVLLMAPQTILPTGTSISLAHRYCNSASASRPCSSSLENEVWSWFGSAKHVCGV